MSDFIYYMSQMISGASSSTQGAAKSFINGFLINPIALVGVVFAVFVYVIIISRTSSGSSSVGATITSGIGTVENAFANIQDGFSDIRLSNPASAVGNINIMPSFAANANSRPGSGLGVGLASDLASGLQAAPGTILGAASTGISSGGGVFTAILGIAGVAMVGMALMWVYRHHVVQTTWEDVKEIVHIDASKAKDLVRKPEVFNISDNIHVYADAKAVCAAYDARLASYKEVEDAYENGAEWCNYGWSDGQMALFPTQQKTFDHLQTIEGHEHDCGRPGINGGYMANPAMKFGVNCFGKKPDMTDQEQQLMTTTSIYPKTAKDIAMEQRVAYWKSRLDEILVSPFNHASWNVW